MRSSKRIGGSIALVLAFAAGCAATDDDGVGSVASGVQARIGMTRCATVEPGIVEQQATESVAKDLSLLKARTRTEIPIIFHIITNSAGEGDVSALVPAQIDVLNGAYRGAGFKFKLVGIELVENDAWYSANISTPEEREMKQALRQGDAGTLNVYTGINDGSLLGWATFPSSYKGHPLLDGIVNLNISMPGGGLEIPIDPTLEPDGIINYSGGDTLTHEAGHWLGLFHTFQGGCTKKGDQIDDTPAEAAPQFFCVDRDSCTGSKFPGTDPI